MAKEKIRIIGAIPGTDSLRPIIEEFQEKGPGLITAFSDQRLRAVGTMLPEEGGLVECASFGDVIGRFMSIHGELAPAIAQKGHVRAAIAEACKALPEESPLFASAGYAGLHKKLARTLEELRDWGLTPEELSTLAAEAEPDLRVKLDSLAFVERQVHEILAQLGPEINANRVQGCLELKLAPGEKLGRLLIVAGSDYSPLQLEWVKWAADNGAKITVVVERAASDLDGLFVDARRIAVHLQGEGFSAGQPNALAAKLFGGREAPSSEMHVEIVSAADPLAEAEWALRGCLIDMAKGTPAAKLAIYVRDLEGYAPLIEFAAKRLEAPIKMTRRVPLLTNSFARLILAALEFSASDDVRSLSGVLRSSYLDLGKEAQSEITGALRQAYASRTAQWSNLQEWAILKSESHPWLAALLKWRFEMIGHPATLPGWIDRLRSMVDDVSWHEASAQGPEATRGRDVRAQSSLQRVLAQSAAIQRIRDNSPLGLQDFAKVARRLWEESDTSIPGNPIGISVVQSAELLGEVDNLYVLGMLEGVFPRRRSEDPVLSDAEREAISLLRKYRPPLHTSHDTARSERDEFYRVCASPTKKIVFSYPLAGEDRDNVPAFYLTEVERAADGRVVKVNRPRPELAPEADEECLSPADQRLRSALGDPKVDPLPNELRTEIAASIVRPPEEGPFSPQELREVMECPFRYMSGRRLGLRVHRERSRWASLRSLPQKVRLPQISTEESARQALVEALEAQLEQLYAEASPYDLALLEAGGKRIIEDWIAREFGSRSLWPKDDGSLQSNTHFGEQPLLGELQLWGKRIGLEGYVTATSTMKDYVVATTTERRRPKEDPESKEISDLDKLEMGLYLLAMHGKRRGVALETESMHGERALYVLPRISTTPLESRRQEGLRVVDLGEPADFYPVVKQKLKEALRRMQQPEVEAIADEHCRWCDYGELCRRHIDFGEDRDPFGGHADADSDL